MILDPRGQPVSTKPQPTFAQKVDQLGRVVAGKTQELLLECLKDLNGGIMPTKKKIKRFLVRERRPDGDLWIWRGEPMLFVGNFTAKPIDGDVNKLQIVLPHKKLYLKTPEKPLEGSN